MYYKKFHFSKLTYFLHFKYFIINHHFCILYILPLIYLSVPKSHILLVSIQKASHRPTLFPLLPYFYLIKISLLQQP